MNKKEKFYPIYKQFKNKPREAIRHLKKVKKGICTKALYREEIGFVDIPWGNNNEINQGFGLKHIIGKHGKDIKAIGYNVEDFIPFVFMFGEIKPTKRSDRALIEVKNRKYRVLISTKWFGEKKHILLTAFNVIKKEVK